MCPRRWEKKPKLLLAWIAVVVLPFESPAGRIEPTQVGERSKEEPARLWKMGKDYFGRGEYSIAAKELQRLVNRYPSTPGYIEAHLLLGLSYIRLKQHQLAVAPLRYYVGIAGFSTEGLRARLNLGHAYLRSGKKHEALLTSLEVIRHKPPKSVPRDVFLEAILVRSWSLVFLDKDSEARRALDSFFTLNEKKTSSVALQTQGHRIELELKLRHCRKLPGKSRMSEADTRTLLQRRGLCVLEGLNIFRQSITVGDSPWVTEARDAALEGIRDFQRACRNPPEPVGRRTTLERKRYREELVDRLVQECQETRNRAKEMLKSLKTAIPASRAHHVDNLLQNV